MALESLQREDFFSEVPITAVVRGLMFKDKAALETALMRGYPLQERSRFGMTPLAAACYTLWPKAVRALLGAGADPHDCGIGSEVMSAVDATVMGWKDRLGAHPSRVEQAVAREACRAVLRALLCWGLVEAAEALLQLPL